MPYKCIVFDLDGTAIANAPQALPTSKVIDTVTEAQHTFRMCAATGRPITNARPILQALKLVDPCIISAGTQIIDPVTEDILWEVRIEADDVAAIMEICTPYQYEILVRNELMGEGAAAANRAIPNSVNVMYIMQCTATDGQTILRKLEALPNITAVGVLSWSGEGLDIHVTHRQATQEHGIAQLLGLIGVTKAETIGIGDGNNDAHLFKAVGRKIAMGNATELLKSQADEICKTVDEDGLAKFIAALPHTHRNQINDSTI